jgi:hypothetical protein
MRVSWKKIGKKAVRREEGLRWLRGCANRGENQVVM